ncbi:hypothetical protein [Candidatus Methanodesulfokora washburnensis]|uniref:Uncharacterized protein n=1 Tax=Candidatus Methanodesulfokora washburnensis TaxID=2478471 RepID=A0A3R9PLQ3_9CREN|nr:hypothetical protein [Candidatus Methanodesulfokores washburnensis]RSN77395.1 hypothetical protein D6D85_02770 [Candidatus Methanodesulfokores washburnensis]
MSWLKRFVLAFSEAIFYIYALIWTIKPRKANSMKEVLDLFYLDFLRLNKSDVEVVKIDENELITRCRNPCPILKLSLMLNVDTKISCRIVSEPVCKYVLHKLNPHLVFQRNYNHIRPYSDSCEERIYFEKGISD